MEVTQDQPSQVILEEPAENQPSQEVDETTIVALNHKLIKWLKREI